MAYLYVDGYLDNQAFQWRNTSSYGAIREEEKRGSVEEVFVDNESTTLLLFTLFHSSGKILIDANFLEERKSRRGKARAQQSRRVKSVVMLMRMMEAIMMMISIEVQLSTRTPS
jgi:hypothetical protein